jgi:hypothetical protein
VPLVSWWFKYLCTDRELPLRESVPSLRSCRVLPGILFSLSEKGSPSPAGIHFSFPPEIFIPTGQTLTAAASAPETASYQTASVPDKGAGNRQRVPAGAHCESPAPSQHDAYLQPTAKSGRRRARVSTAVETTLKIFLVSQVTRGGRAGRGLQAAAALPEAAERVVKLYTAWGKPEKVAEWREKIKAQPAGVPKPR